MLNRSILFTVVLLAGILLTASLFGATDTAAAAYTDELLTVGTYGEDVTRVQQGLTHLNYSTGGIDGIYGPRTASAVSNFQQDNNLYVDGIAGPKTQSALYNAVSQVQKDLTYVGFDTKGVDGCFGPNTLQAVTHFQTIKKLKVDGIVGPETRAMLAKAVAYVKSKEAPPVVYIVQNGDTLSGIAAKYKTTVQAIKDANKLTSELIVVGQKLTIPSSSSPTPQPPANNPPSRQGRFGEAIPWSQAKNLFPVGAVATITDVDTGLTYKVKRRGGSYHADVQPLTAADTANMKKAYGGSWSWTRHAILVSIGGRTIAASQNGMPHGGQSIYDNNFPGHFCIHFLGSTTHGNNQWSSSGPHVDAAHQAAVRKAAGLSG